MLVLSGDGELPGINSLCGSGNRNIVPSYCFVGMGMGMHSSLPENFQLLSLVRRSGYIFFYSFHIYLFTNYGSKIANVSKFLYFGLSLGQFRLMTFSTILLFGKISNYVVTFSLLPNIGDAYRIFTLLLSQSY